MTDWQTIDSAPKDGSQITARNAEGEEASCRWVVIHKEAGIDGWVLDISYEGNTEAGWRKYTMFYPTEWKSQ